VDESGGEKQERSAEGAAIERGGDSAEEGGGGKGARVEILVGEADGCAGNGDGEKNGDGEDGGPVGLGRWERAPSDGKAGGKDQESGGELPEKDREAEGKVGKADGGGDELVEDGGLELEAEEIGIVGEERGIEVALDGGEVESVVFETGVVALDGDGGSGDEQQKGESAGARQVEVILARELRAAGYELRAVQSARAARRGIINARQHGEKTWRGWWRAHAGMGSFDCACSLRSRCFAQDDKVTDSLSEVVD